MGKKKTRKAADRVDVLAYAVAANPDEDWDVCCMCEAAEDEAPFGLGLTRALVLLEDNTLARSAWCGRLQCRDNYYQSIKLTLPPSLTQ